MKKYIDMLTIGNLTPHLLSALAPLRLKYNIVSCRNEASAQAIKPISKLILTQKETTVYINDELVNLPYIEDYLENAAVKIEEDKLDYYYTVAVNKNNIEKLPQLLNDTVGLLDNDSTCILVVPTSEFSSIEEMSDNMQIFIESRSDKIVYLPVDLPYDFCRLIPAVKYMQENDLDNKTLIQLDLDSTYSKAAMLKLYRLIEETDNCAITVAATPDILFDTPVVSNKLTAVKPCFFNDLLWIGLRPAVIANSPANYWHTFNLWSSDISQTTYYTKFDSIVPDNSETHITTKAFYNELARLGINKLLTEEV